MATLAPGDRAPAFTLTDQNGKKVKLADFKGKKVVVYFYPKADTPGCTAQACGLRDIAGEVGDTAIVGISPDPPAKQARFDTKYGLGFPLLSDENHAVAFALGPRHRLHHRPEKQPSPEQDGDGGEDGGGQSQDEIEP